MHLDMDAFIEQYADAHRGESLTNLYREQDRLIRVIHHLEIQVTKPHKMIHMLERKLEALEFLVNRKYGNLKLVS
jgi:hypothetical protein